MIAATIDPRPVREAIQARLANGVTVNGTVLAGLAGRVNVYAYRPPAPMFPSVSVVPDSEYIDYLGTFGPTGLSTLNLVLMVECGGRAIDQQMRLDELLGFATTLSVPSLLMAEQTLSGAVQSCVPQVARIVSERTPEGDNYYALIPLAIMTKRGGN